MKQPNAAPTTVSGIEALPVADDCAIVAMAAGITNGAKTTANKASGEKSGDFLSCI